MKECMEMLPHRTMVINLAFERLKRNYIKQGCAAPPKSGAGEKADTKKLNPENKLY